MLDGWLWRLLSASRGERVVWSLDDLVAVHGSVYDTHSLDTVHRYSSLYFVDIDV